MTRTRPEPDGDDHDSQDRPQVRGRRRRSGRRYDARGTAHAAADDEFKTLSGVEAEPLNAEEMEAVQGKAFLGTRMYGRFLLWYDSEINYPLGFDTRLPAVQGVFAWLQAGAIPRDPNVVINFLIQADPQGLTRFSPIGRLTANGRPCIRGFTVGC